VGRIFCAAETGLSTHRSLCTTEADAILCPFEVPKVEGVRVLVMYATPLETAPFHHCSYLNLARLRASTRFLLADAVNRDRLRGQLLLHERSGSPDDSRPADLSPVRGFAESKVA
jgi:hypothetical protein